MIVSVLQPQAPIRLSITQLAEAAIALDAAPAISLSLTQFALAASAQSEVVILQEPAAIALTLTQISGGIPIIDEYGFFAGPRTITVAFGQGPIGPIGLVGPVGPGGPIGPQGPSGEAAQTKTYHQVIPASVWVINHNLGVFPSVVVVDSANSVVEGDILHNSPNQVTLTFVGAFAGTAYLI